MERPNANAPTKSNEDDKTKEPPRLVWFKPTDKRVPLIAIPFSSAPPDLMEREEQYTSMIMTVRPWVIFILEMDHSLLVLGQDR